MARKKIVLDEMEQRWEAEIGRGEWKPVVPQRRKELQSAAKKTLEAVRAKRGGPRPGAGRKPSGKVRLWTQVKPETMRILLRKAGGPRGIGEVVDRLVAEKQA